MRIAILGCGRVGSSLAVDLDRSGHAVSIVDSRNDAFQRFLPADFGGDAVLGNGIDEDVLQRAGLDQAEVFLALTDDELRSQELALRRLRVPRGDAGPGVALSPVRSAYEPLTAHPT